MRYIKKFENERVSKLSYKMHDYVYIDTKNYPEPILPYGFIQLKCTPFPGRTWDYSIECYNTEKNKFWWYYVDESYILRKLTDEEISEFKMLKNTVKYNL